MQTAPDRAALSQCSVFFLCFSSPLLTPSGAWGTSTSSPGSCWSQIPRGLATRKGCPCEGTPMGSLAAPGHGAASPGCLCHQRAPHGLLLSLFFPLLVSPLQHSPAAAHPLPNSSRESWGKGMVPPPNSQPNPAQGRLDAGREASCPGQDRGAKRAPVTGKTCQGSQGSPPPPSALPGGPSVPEFSDGHARGACPVTLLCPRGHQKPSLASIPLGWLPSPGQLR